MKYLKLFGQKFDINDYIDFIIVNLKRESNIIETQISDNKLFAYISIDISENIEDYMKNTSRHRDIFVLYSKLIGASSDSHNIFLCEKSFYEKHTQLHIENLKWSKHQLAIELEKTSSGLASDMLYNMWKNVKFLKINDDFTCLYNVRGHNDLELWNKKKHEDPICFFDNDPLFQYELFDSIN